MNKGYLIYLFLGYLIKWVGKTRRGSTHADPKQEETTEHLHWEEGSLPPNLPRKGWKIFSPPSNSSANEKPLHSPLPVSASGLCAYQQPLQASPFSFIKEHSSSLSRLAYSFCSSMLIPSWKSLLFLKKKEDFAGKTTVLFLRSTLHKWRPIQVQVHITGSLTPS